MSSMFKFPIPSEAEPRWRAWLVCPDCQVWCHNSTGLGRVQGGTTLACTCTHLVPHCTPHCTPHLTASLTSLHPSTGPAWAPPGHRGEGCEAAAGPAVVAGWRGWPGVCPLCGGRWCTGHLPPADTDTGAAELVLPLLRAAVT